MKSVFLMLKELCAASRKVKFMKRSEISIFETLLQIILGFQLWIKI